MTMAHQKESIIPSDRTAKVAQAADRRRLLQAKNANDDYDKQQKICVHYRAKYAPGCTGGDRHYPPTRQ
jgi:hypothetical protein